MEYYKIGEIFGREVNFPLDEKVVIIIGSNGTGKTHTLNLLNEYLIDKKEDVLYLKENRYFECNEDMIKTMLVVNNLLGNEKAIKLINDVNFKIDDLKYYNKGEFIESGAIQIVNMLAQICTNESNGLNVLIDTPETNININAQKMFIDSILSLEKVKKLVIATHAPSLISNKHNMCINVERIVDIYGKRINVEGII